MADDALARRMFRARQYRDGLAERRLALREISAEVSRLLAREKDYDPSVIARWLKGEQEPGTREQWIALAKSLQVDVGWLAFGDASKAPAPPITMHVDPFGDGSDMGIPESPSTRPFTEEEAEESPAKRRAAGGTRKPPRER